MSDFVRMTRESRAAGQLGSVGLVSRAELRRCHHWKRAFVGKRKDHRYYELVEDTLQQGFDYRYFAVKDAHGEVRAVQPFFILDQDLTIGVSPKIAVLIKSIRCVWPRCFMMRTLMVGCAAGEGHLDGDELSLHSNARLLASAIVTHARDLKARLIVLKEFRAQYRETLKCF